MFLQADLKQPQTEISVQSVNTVRMAKSCRKFRPLATVLVYSNVSVLIPSYTHFSQIK